MRKLFVFLSVFLLSVCQAYASERVSLSGNLEHNGLFAMEDAAIGTEKYSFPYLSNTYLSLLLRSEWVNVGVRVETMEAPLPGYESQFKGSGIGNIFVEGQWHWGRLRIGDVYSQFGSGLILRLYEERSLGVDNSLRGARLELTPYKGIMLEAIGGKQRVYWNCYDKTLWNLDMSKGAVVGGNLELQVEEWSEVLQNEGIGLNIGGSWVSKYEPMDTIYATINPPRIYNLPLWVGAADARVRLNAGGWNMLAEYAWKVNDPTAENEFSYKSGQALLLSLSYSKKGMSVLAQVKRSENMGFRSDRVLTGIAGQINHLPAFSTTHTYQLAALYPYATQLLGEWAFQGEVRYTWKKNTQMGGRYGTTLKLNAAHIRGTRDGFFFGMSANPYYTDINLELNKKLSKQWYLNAMYMYQTYNKQQIEGHGDLVRSHIFVADAKYRVNDKVQMRAELQYLLTKQDEGQWIYGLYELSLWNSLMLSLSDMYNIGGTTAATKHHYYMAGVTYQKAGHRLVASFGRTRAGYNCTGGVCRYVPAQKGFNLSYNYNF